MKKQTATQTAILITRLRQSTHRTVTENNMQWLTMYRHRTANTRRLNRETLMMRTGEAD